PAAANANARGQAGGDPRGGDPRGDRRRVCHAAVRRAQARARPQTSQKGAEGETGEAAAPAEPAAGRLAPILSVTAPRQRIAALVAPSPLRGAHGGQVAVPRGTELPMGGGKLATRRRWTASRGPHALPVKQVVWRIASIGVLCWPWTAGRTGLRWGRA